MNFILNYSTQTQSVEFELSVCDDLYNEAYTFIFDRILYGCINIDENDVLKFFKSSNSYQYKKLTFPIDTTPEALYNIIKKYFHTLPTENTNAMIRLVVPILHKSYAEKFKTLIDKNILYQSHFSTDDCITLEMICSVLDN